MVIGVAAVIAVVTFVNGINGYVAEKIFNLGADVFIIFKDLARRHQCRPFPGRQKRKDLTMEDYHAVLEGASTARYVARIGCATAAAM